MLIYQICLWIAIVVLFFPSRNKTHKMWRVSTTDNSPMKGLGNDSKEEFQTWTFFWVIELSWEWYCHEATSVNVQAALCQPGLLELGWGHFSQNTQWDWSSGGVWTHIAFQASTQGAGMANIRPQHVDAGGGTPKLDSKIEDAPVPILEWTRVQDLVLRKLVLAASSALNPDWIAKL